MGKYAPSDRTKELRIEKLFLRKNLAEKMDSGEFLGLDEFTSFIWHNHPNHVSEITSKFLKELIDARKEDKRYTQGDWIRFCHEENSSKSNRDIVLYKLLHLGLVERINRTKMKYEIRLSDKFLQYLELLSQSWIMICENK